MAKHKGKNGRGFSIFDDPYYNLSVVASATDFTGFAPSAIASDYQAESYASLYAVNRQKPSKA